MVIFTTTINTFAGHMEDFNLQYTRHPSLDLLKDYLLQHGTYQIVKKKELFSMQGKTNRKGAYIKSGSFRYTCIDDRGNEHIVGYAFPNEFVGSLDTWINPNQPSPVTIEAICDSEIYHVTYPVVKQFFDTNMETLYIRCILAEQSYSVIYRRLLDFYCKNTEELYLDLLNRCPDIQEYITLKEIASFLQVTPETISHIRKRLKE